MPGITVEVIVFSFFALANCQHFLMPNQQNMMPWQAASGGHNMPTSWHQQPYPNPAQVMHLNCGPPPVIPNGGYTTIQSPGGLGGGVGPGGLTGTAHGDRRVIYCHEGYSLNGQNSLIICGWDGKWSTETGAAPICLKVDTSTSLPVANEPSNQTNSTLKIPQTSKPCDCISAKKGARFEQAEIGANSGDSSTAVIVLAVLFVISTLVAITSILLCLRPHCLDSCHLPTL